FFLESRRAVPPPPPGPRLEDGEDRGRLARPHASGRLTVQAGLLPPPGPRLALRRKSRAGEPDRQAGARPPPPKHPPPPPHPHPGPRPRRWDATPRPARRFRRPAP